MALFDSTFIRYSLVGLLNTGITLGTVFLLMFLNVHYLIANGVGYLAGALNSFYFLINILRLMRNRHGRLNSQGLFFQWFFVTWFNGFFFGCG